MASHPTDPLEVIEDLPDAPVQGAYLRRPPRKRKGMSEFGCYVIFTLLFLASVGGFLMYLFHDLSPFRDPIDPERLWYGLVGLSLAWAAAYWSGYGMMMNKAGKSMFSRSAMLEAAGIRDFRIVRGFNIIAYLMNVFQTHKVNRGFAQRFGKPPLFALGLTLLPMIFFPVLGIGPAKYRPRR